MLGNAAVTDLYPPAEHAHCFFLKLGVVVDLKPKLGRLRIAFRRSGCRAVLLFHKIFGGAHRKSARDDLCGNLALAALVLQRKQRARMPGGKLARIQHRDHVVAEIQQAQGVGDGASALADLGGDLLLREVVAVDQCAVCLRLLNRVEVFALNILDQRDLRGFKVALVEDNDRHFGQTCHLGRAIAPLARDDLIVPVRDLAHQNRLQDAVHRDRIRQFCQRLAFKDAARLIRLRFDLSDAQARDAALLLD